MEQRLSLVTLGVADLETSRRFYERLGWTASGEFPTAIFFQLNGIVLGLYSRSALAEEARLDDGGSGFGGIALAYNARSKDEVDAVLKEAEHAGATILKLAEDVFWGGYSGYFADPDGHPWEVAWNPTWDITAEGNIRMGDG